MAEPSVAQRLLALAHILTEEDLSLSSEELLCFLTVAVRPGLSVGELVEQTGLPQSTVSRHLKRLSSGQHRRTGEIGPLKWELEIGRQGLIDQQVDRLNGKQKALYLSADGEALLERFGGVVAGGRIELPN